MIFLSQILIPNIKEKGITEPWGEQNNSLSFYRKALTMTIRIIFCGLVITLQSCNYNGTNPSDQPNVIIIFCDDMGYADIGSFGAEDYSTPNLDRMAEKGMRFTDFCATTGVCSASRASLLTGSYHERVGIQGALFPDDKIGLNPDEITIAEILKEQDYATSIIGKWHLGSHPEFNPINHGFDEFFGLLYSNDMWPKNTNPNYEFPPLALMDGEKVIAHLQDQSLLTTWYTERALEFISRNADKPFFLYLAHSMPHVPLYVSKKFEGKSENGIYGDVIMEIDWSTGKILDKLKKLNIDENTLVIFTSDNGPWLNYGDHAGSAEPLREGKGTIFEGGIREPTLMYWPGTIPAGVTCTEFVSTLDILPTVTRLVGGKLPGNKIDGHDILPLMINEKGAASPTEVFYCYYRGELQAIRSGKWKLHFPHRFRKTEGLPKGSNGEKTRGVSGAIELSLFNLEEDIGERSNLVDQYPEVVQQLEKDKLRSDGELLGMRCIAEERGTNLLLNIPPNKEGIIPKNTVDTLIRLEENYKKII